MSDTHTSRSALVPALRKLEHDAMLAGVPAGARYRVADRIAEEADRREAAATPRRWIPALTFVAGAALVLVVVGLGLRPTVRTAAPVAARSLGAFAVDGEDCRVATAGGEATTRGACRLSSGSVTAQTWDEARVSPWGGSLHVHAGTVVFEVAPVPAGGPPVAVRVSHGRIEVLGTRFAVDQDEDGGHVDLFEGRIRFVGDDGTRRDIAPGQRLGWGDRAAPAPDPIRVTPVPPPPAPGGVSEPPAPPAGDRAEAEPPPRPPRRPVVEAPVRSDDAAAEIVERVESLRRQGRYAEAARQLRQSLRGRWSKRAAEVFSFELGTILDRHLGRADDACAHWRAHARRFGDRGRYATAVAELRARCDE